MSSCFKCGDDTERTTTVLAEEGWVVVQGATSSSYCRCAPGRFLRNGQCLPCGVGASCPGSDSLEVLPGFHAKALEPGLIFKCFGLPGRCPGGLPGTCAPGRDAGSPGCSECLEGLQPNGAECAPCSAGDYVRLAAYGLLVLFATAGLHLLFLVGGHGSNRLQSKVVTAALCSSHLITYAQLYAVMSQIQAVNWAEPFLSFLELFKVLSLETMLSSVWSISCITSLTPEANFLTRTLLVPLLLGGALYTVTLDLWPFLGLLGFLNKAAKSLFFSYPPKCKVLHLGAHHLTRCFHSHGEEEPWDASDAAGAQSCLAFGEPGIPLPALLHHDVLRVPGALSVQRASQWPCHHADGAWRLLQLLRAALALVHCWRGGDADSSRLLRALHMDRYEGAPQTRGQGGHRVCPGDLLPDDEVQARIRSLLSGFLAPQLAPSGHAHVLLRIGQPLDDGLTLDNQCGDGSLFQAMALPPHQPGRHLGASCDAGGLVVEWLERPGPERFIRHGLLHCHLILHGGGHTCGSGAFSGTVREVQVPWGRNEP